MSVEEMSKGEVLWFDTKRGFGFIRDADQGDDVFVHYSKIDAEPGEFRSLDSGDIVEYERFISERDGKEKVQADCVKVIIGSGRRVFKASNR